MARKRRKKKKGIFVFVLLLIVIFAVCMIWAYSQFTKSSPYINATPTPDAKINSTVMPSISATPRPSASRRPSGTNKPTTRPESTPRPTSTSGSAENVRFSTYESDDYGFECPYPDNFSPYSGNNSNAVAAFRSSDGAASQNIIACEDLYENPAMSMRDFVSSYPTGIIIENRAGGDYFYALIKYDDMYIYRYSAFENGSEIGFEFCYNENLEEKYSSYPEEIRDYFTIY